MPLHVSPAPAPALRSVLTALGSPTALQEARTPSLRAAQGPATAELPLPVHVLDRGAPEGTARTRFTSWRFLVRCGERALAAAETRLTADGWAFSHFFEGPYVGATEQALREAELFSGLYQPRLLSVPELYMLTLWLHGSTGDDGSEGALEASDVLIPLAPAPPGIAAYLPHRVSDFLPALRRRLTPTVATAPAAAPAAATAPTTQAPPLLGSPA
ncbi:hypothetical protein [Streptomyces tsukubensis]|uniref:hypothetical protein n=1 Tax=Streptomyces tsukubensis TaxID=83656 RepID=UPI001D056FFD|nr:hypothetical protein [Streptomyces tsukubensis]